MTHKLLAGAPFEIELRSCGGDWDQGNAFRDQSVHSYALHSHAKVTMFCENQRTNHFVKCTICMKLRLYAFALHITASTTSDLDSLQ